MSQGEISPIFCVVVFRREHYQMKETVRLDVEAPPNMSCCMCELMDTAPFPSDDRHAVVKQPKWAQEHRLHCVVLCVWWIANVAHR